jgi:hypothetical protein
MVGADSSELVAHNTYTAMTQIDREFLVADCHAPASPGARREARHGKKVAGVAETPGADRGRGVENPEVQAFLDSSAARETVEEHGSSREDQP